MERDRDAADDTLFLTGGRMGILFVFRGIGGGVAVPSPALPFDFAVDLPFGLMLVLVALDLADYT